MQEVFVRILKYWHTYRGTSRFSTWVFRVARNVRGDYFRSRRMRETTFDGGDGTGQRRD